MGMRTHINGMQILYQVMKEPGWWDGIVYRPDAPFADEGASSLCSATGMASPTIGGQASTT